LPEAFKEQATVEWDFQSVRESALVPALARE
jgi:hypothetical protein